MTTTISQLADAYNALRNAGLGRGVDLPAGVSPELSDRVGKAYEAFRAWLADQGPIDDASHQIALGSASQWVELYAELAALVTRATGKALPETPSTPIVQAASQVARALALPATILLATAAAVLLALQMAKAKGRR